MSRWRPTPVPLGSGPRATLFGKSACSTAGAHKLARCAFAVLRDGTPYRDPATDYEALLVQRNAPRWLRTLRKFDILVSHDDGTVSVRWPERTVPMR